MKLIYYTQNDFKEHRVTVKSKYEIAKHILIAWNYEKCVYDENLQIIFDPYESMVINNEILNEYGLGIKEHDGFYRVYNLKSGYMYKY